MASTTNGRPVRRTANGKANGTTNGSSDSPTPRATGTKKTPKDDKRASGGAKAASNASAVDDEERTIVVPYQTLRIAVLVGALSVLLYYAASHEPAQPSSYILCSSEGRADIYTVNEKNERVECMWVNGSFVGAVGTLDEVDQQIPPEARITMGIQRVPPGAIVVPGLTDSHCHILEFGFSRLISLWEGKSASETVSKVKDYILANPDIRSDVDKVIEGWGWDHMGWDVEKMPTWEHFEQDKIFKNRRIILTSKDGHAIWVSKRVLEEDGPFPDGEVEGGMIFRDEAGNPTGVFLDSAQDLITRYVPTQEDHEKRFQLAVDKALSVGLTSLHDAGLKPDSLDFFTKRAEKEGLPIRIYGMTYFDEHGEYWGNKTRPIIGLADGRLNARSVKIFADGALRTGGAALYEPYTDSPNTRGVLRISPEILTDVIPRFLKDGWQTNIHAIGDRANGVVLDAFEAALNKLEVDVASLRPRLEHAQFMTEADMKRLGELGVIASVQPTHAISDMWFAEERLGSERVKGLYAFRSMLEHGARITLGSDFPVEDINPLAGFYAAVTRVSADRTSPHGPGGWFPSQRLTRQEGLRGMTIDAAYASFAEDTAGSLEVGKRADYTVLSQDIMEVAPEAILSTTVLATALDGRVVYGYILRN